jgi:hypothetical protein
VNRPTCSVIFCVKSNIGYSALRAKQEAKLPDTIPPDSTIADVTGSLRNPVEYVRKVLENFMLSGLDRQKAVVRIGVAGHGVSPDYKIEYPTELAFEGDLTIPHQAIFEIYQGRIGTA